jgi:hypothetical protein
MPGRLLSALGAAALAAAVAGCGSGTITPTKDALAPARQRIEERQRQERLSIDLPRNIPQAEQGPADARALRVIRAWLRALDRGDVARAADYFAQPSKFQNTGTPVLTLDNRTERVAVNLSLSCGARAVHAGSAGAFQIVTFHLIERPGGDCGQGVGGMARGAIRVHGQKIVEWYRLPDTPGGPLHKPPPARIAVSGPSA